MLWQFHEFGKGEKNDLTFELALQCGNLSRARGATSVSRKNHESEMTSISHENHKE